MPRFPFRQSWASLSAPASGIPSGSTTAEQDAIGKHSAAGTAATARKEMARALYTARFTVVGLLDDSRHARNNLGRLGR
jgi:hypothetical protein